MGKIADVDIFFWNNYNFVSHRSKTNTVGTQQPLVGPNAGDKQTFHNTTIQCLWTNYSSVLRLIGFTDLILCISLSSISISNQLIRKYLHSSLSTCYIVRMPRQASQASRTIFLYTVALPNSLKASIKLHSVPSSKAELANELEVAALRPSAARRGMTWVKSF